MSDNQEKMRKESGKQDYQDPLVTFLYVLARDHLPGGIIQEAINKATQSQEVQFTNGWLAQQCKFHADLLRESKIEGTIDNETIRVKPNLDHTPYQKS